MNEPARRGAQSPSTSGGVQALWLQVMLFTGARLLIDTNFRMVYPYLATFQTGLGISLASISLVLTVRALTGFIGPIFAPLADRVSSLHSPSFGGRRLSMLLGIGAFTSGALLILLWPGYLTFFIGSILMATAGLIYMPAMQALLSDRVPFERRGRIIGFTELSWALSFFIGVPLIGLLLERTGSWVSPFVLLAILGAAFFFVLFFAVPRGQTLAAEHSQADARFDLRALLRNPNLLLGVATAALMTCANESVNVVFGLWLENSFQMQLVALGGASLVIGIGELGGAGMSTLIVDRLGKQRSVGLGLTLNCLAGLALIFLGRTATGAMVGLFFFYLTSEFAVVSTIAMMSEAVPWLRATAIAATISSFNVGRAVSSALGPFIFSSWGFPINAAAAVVFNIGALIFLSRLKIGQKQPETDVQTGQPSV